MIKDQEPEYLYEGFFSLCIEITLEETHLGFEKGEQLGEMEMISSLSLEDSLRGLK